MVMKLNGTNGLTFPDTTTLASAGQSSVQAWVNFDGTTATPSTIRASFNVSSVTRNATGDYTVNFATALVDANYSVAGVCGGTAGAVTFSVTDQTTLRTANAFRSLALTTSGVVINAAQVNVAIFR
jgi:hypothetical protein